MYAQKQTLQSLPQTVPEPGLVQNSAGGFVYEISDLSRLRRFLVLGCEGGTLYASEQKLGLENAAALKRLIQAGRGPECVEEIRKFSTEGRAPKQGPMLFALAVCAASGDHATREAVYQVLSKVCRIPTHLFMFLEFSKQLKLGWGRAHRTAIGKWYNSKKAQNLAYAITKYKNREGWTHLDVIRLSHVKADDESHNVLYQYLSKGYGKMMAHPTVAALGEAKPVVGTDMDEEGGADVAAAVDPLVDLQAAVSLLTAVEEAKTCKSAARMSQLIADFNLAREHVPTELLNSVEVWAALLKHMPMTALIRNLAKMTAIGLLTPLGDGTATVVAKLLDAEAVRASRLHPLAVLIAMRTYQSGHGDKGSLVWQPIDEVVAALDRCFYLAFSNVESTGKRHLLALDVSGSMSGGQISGCNITPREASGAMAMVLAEKERATFMAFGHTFVPLPISKGMRLDSVIRAISGLPFGRTDCSLPMLWALEQKAPVDVFVVFTDSETYAGDIKPAAALKQYREAMGIDSKLVVVGMTATGFSIADPSDPGMLDVVGFDASSPEVIRQFVLGNI